MDLTTALSSLNLLKGYGIVVREEPGIAGQVMKLAHELEQSAAYGCYYLTLAERHDCEFWTGDRRFFKSVSGHHVRVRWIGEGT